MAVALEIIYETHAISVDNELGIATGWLQGALSERGRQAAVKLGERRRGEDIAAVFTSDLRRAVETAEIAFGGSGVPIRLEPRLRECNYGRLNGAPVAQLEAVRAQHIDEPFPDGESYRQVVDRVREFLGDIAAELEHRRIVLISHSAPRWALQHLLCGVALEDLVDAPFAWQPGWRFVVGSSTDYMTGGPGWAPGSKAPCS